jgi:hypothetical protein
LSTSVRKFAPSSALLISLLATWNKVEKETDSISALPHEQSAFVLFTKPPALEVVSNSATSRPLGSCSFAKRAEVASMGSPRQIVHEAIGGVAHSLRNELSISSEVALDGSSW